MQINKTLKGDLEVKSVKKSDDGTRILTLSFKTRIDAGDPDWDEHLMSLVFGSLNANDDVFWFSSIKPNLGCESHMLKLCGHKIRAIPELNTIKPIEDMASVVAEILIPVEINKMQQLVMADLVLACGDIVEIVFTPEQQRLPLTIKRKEAKA